MCAVSACLVYRCSVQRTASKRFYPPTVVRRRRPLPSGATALCTQDALVGEDPAEEPADVDGVAPGLGRGPLSSRALARSAGVSRCAGSTHSNLLMMAFIRSDTAGDGT